MAPRDFSETGAVGAGSGAGASPGTPGATTPTPAPTELPGGGIGSLAYMATPPAPTPPQGSAADRSFGGSPRPAMGGPQDTTGVTPWVRQFLQDTGGFQRSFAEGGAIPMEGEDDLAMGPANGLSEMMAKAMGSAQEVLAYGRKKHGLGGGDEGGAVGDQAGLTRMPMKPGNQSESGVQPLQPAPGRLPPTDNPFGKRSEAEPAEDAGAIDTEEDVA